MPSSQTVSVHPILDCRRQEREQSDRDHQYRELAWSNDIMKPRVIFRLQLKLKKLINGETESDQRGRCSDPGHQRSFVREDCALQGELVTGRLFDYLLFALCHPGHPSFHHELPKARVFVTYPHGLSSPDAPGSLPRATLFTTPRISRYGMKARTKATRSASPG